MKTIVKSSMVSIGLMVGMVSGLTAEVNVPNTFTAGESASAAQVNENFTTLKDGVNANTARLSGIKHIEPAKLTLTGDPQSLESITVNVPTDGYIHLTATGNIHINNKTNATAALIYIWITDEADGGTSGLLMDSQLYLQPSHTGLSYHKYMLQRVFPVSQGENTFYVRSLKVGTSLNASTVDLIENRLTATFHASEL